MERPSFSKTAYKCLFNNQKIVSRTKFRDYYRKAYEQKAGPGTLYYECRRCGRRTKTYRKIKRHLRSCGT